MLRVVVLDPTCSCKVPGFEEHFVGMGEGERFGYACVCVGSNSGSDDTTTSDGRRDGGSNSILKLFSSACVDGVGECGFGVAAKPDFGILKQITP